MKEEPEPGLPEQYAADPLAEFIEMQGDDPMFRTVVNGQQKLIPLDKARATIQKSAAADQRLEHANQIYRDLEQREQSLNARENELNSRINNPPKQEQPSPDVPLMRKSRSKPVK